MLIVSSQGMIRLEEKLVLSGPVTPLKQGVVTFTMPLSRSYFLTIPVNLTLLPLLLTSVLRNLSGNI
ncbi:MAG: hypothetical protein ACI8PB_005439 [Desulforhopalus sp.]|jgi:hypothetical protein